ncbi:hypothetical protein HWV62_5451 [Athelia sp. TMB]|nr:hypothetical protein HWV62_5451 [Athelia sp. TMB]
MDYIFWLSIVASGAAAPTDLHSDDAVTPITANVLSYDPFGAPTVTNTLMLAFIISYLLTIMASYNIVCQWLKGLFVCQSCLPPHLQLSITPEQIKGKIPKFHFNAHGKKDHTQYSFNYTKGAGQNEGEGIERNWSYIKSGMIDIGSSLLKKMVKAMSEAITHCRAFKELDACLKEDKADQVAKWEEEYTCDACALLRVLCHQFRSRLGPSSSLTASSALPANRPTRASDETRHRLPTGPGAPIGVLDPFEAMVSDPDSSTAVTTPLGIRCLPVALASLIQVTRIVNEEAAKSGLSTAPHTQSTFLLIGMDIEHIQSKLIYNVKEHKTPTTLQEAQLQECHVALRKCIKIFCSLQEQDMPDLQRVLCDPTVLEDTTDILPECVHLYLPSELSSGSHRNKACTNGLADIEEWLREASARDKLGHLQQNLHTRTYLNKWELKDEDVCALNEFTLTEHEKLQREHRIKTGGQFDEDTYDGVIVEGTSGESRCTLSWIWMSTQGDDKEMNECLRVEWAKCKAHQAHWHEELMLLQEEMCRVIAFSYARATWWKGRPEQRPDVDSALAEGLQAYALEHAAQETAFMATLEEKWGSVHERVKAVLKALTKPGFLEEGLNLTTPIPVDVEDDIDMDSEPSAWTAEE